MSGEERQSAVRDEELSALLDGELDAERARALRARIAADPALSARLAALERVDAALQALPEPEVPDRIRARILAETVGGSARRAGADSGPRPRRSAPRRRARWLGTIGSALAAGLALYLLLSRGRPTPEESAGAPTLAAVPAPDPAPAPEPTQIAVGTTPAPEPDAAVELSDVPEEDLAVAMDLETLSDLDVIEHLEVLELLAMLEPAEAG